MRVAFYAPMKPPDHPVPSGDRRMARLLIDALRLGGHEVTLASRFRSWDAGTVPGRPARLRQIGERLAGRLIQRWREAPDRPEAWLTYHLYHKAPDWLGPPVAAALGIPYLLAEASHAAKRATGPWAEGHAAAAEAIRRAAAILTFSAVDAEGLRRLVPADRIVRLTPFIATAPWAAAAARRRPGPVPRLLAVGMMRPGDKQRSYEVLATALGRLADRPWHLTVVGDGPARAAVESLFDPARTRFLGAVALEALPPLYAQADLMAWPAVNEAYGMSLLEAQASGLPVVAGRAGGVPEIVRDGTTGLLAAPGDPAAFADAVALLLDDPALRRRLGDAALRLARAEHDIASAAALLSEVLATARRRRRASPSQPDCHPSESA